MIKFQTLYTQMCGGEIWFRYLNESHFHQEFGARLRAGTDLATDLVQEPVSTIGGARQLVWSVHEEVGYNRRKWVVGYQFSSIYEKANNSPDAVDSIATSVRSGT